MTSFIGCASIRINFREHRQFSAFFIFVGPLLSASLLLSWVGLTLRHD